MIGNRVPKTELRLDGERLSEESGVRTDGTANLDDLPEATPEALQVDGLVIPEFWSIPPGELLQRLGTGPQGLTPAEATRRLEIQNKGRKPARSRSRWLVLLVTQFQSPIILILIAAACLSAALGQRTDALIILAIVLGSGLVGFWQEYGAAEAVEALLARVKIMAAVIRGGVEVEVPADEVVPGELVVLNAGDVIPADCLVLTSRDLHVDEATLTGETYPAEKLAGLMPAGTPLALRKNSLFLGTHVVSGTATALAIHTGKQTEFGHISQQLDRGRPEAEFERGVRRFGYLLMEFTLVLVLLIFAVNVSLGRPALEALLFSTALAVGLTPQLLPLIIGVNLSHGAREMARRKVIVKRLASIENFGSMNVLCSDKTGTLTEGLVRLEDALDWSGRPNDRVLFYAYLNASFEAGFSNPIDDAIRKHKSHDLSGCSKIGEAPYDFIRKRLSVAVELEGRRLLITKGALTNVLAVCSHAEGPTGEILDLGTVLSEIEARYTELGTKGFRVLGVAYRDIGTDPPLLKELEEAMTFLGFLVLDDPPKPGLDATIRELRDLGIALKILTGDNRLVAQTVGRAVGLGDSGFLTGPEVALMSDGALTNRVGDVDIFAEVEPNQKERILLALKKAGNVVGYLGDGINDASALHAADVGISVDSAVDVAKEAADIVLLEKELAVLLDGIRAGRIAFANTLKYVYMATSANFGNMLSMACLSLFIPFLPLLPKQILFMNMLTDLPEMAIATDDVDREQTDHPRRWDVRDIRNFMLIFGVISSFFDFVTFGVLLVMLHASPDEFRTGWFMESVISASVIVLVIRTRRPFFASRPGRALFVSTILVGCVTLLLPFTTLGALLGFRGIPAVFVLALGLIVVLYVLVAELAKRIYYRASGPQPN